MDIYGFYNGTVFDAYEWLGAHVTPTNVIFRTFAPNAEGVCVRMDENEYPMYRVENGQFYEYIHDLSAVGKHYEYRIYHHGTYTDHCDPYGFSMELRPDHKSIVCDINKYSFQDNYWMRHRNDCKNQPLNIYELHLGSWKKNDWQWYNYDELADLLIPYLKEYNYTHIEILPISEHPCDESWGYQNTGFFAPTSRYGTPLQLKSFIDKLHQNNIGILLDFVPAHFALDSYALASYDGSILYEYPHQDVGVSEWGSCNFMHSRGEVRSFLQSCANYWLKEFHFDGLRMDAIRNLIYWQGDERRGVNNNGVSFLRYMNQQLKKLHPSCILSAEDSSSFANVTASADNNGLGFDYKWDMGWMHDTLDFFKKTPAERYDNYHKLTFSMMYYYNEHFILPFSHDEVVHGKATIIGKIYGEYEEKFAQLRSLYMYMYVHPGKKLNFMGNEIAHFREWDEKRQQDWDLLSYPQHKAFSDYMKALNSIYKNNSAFYSKDFDNEGFSWLDCNRESECIYAICRNGNSNRILAIFNFSDQHRHYETRLSDVDNLNLLLSTDWRAFGGNTENNSDIYSFNNNIFSCDLAPYSSLLFAI